MEYTFWKGDNKYNPFRDRSFLGRCFFLPHENRHRHTNNAPILVKLHSLPPPSLPPSPAWPHPPPSLLSTPPCLSSHRAPHRQRKPNHRCARHTGSTWWAPKIDYVSVTRCQVLGSKMLLNKTLATANIKLHAINMQ